MKKIPKLEDPAQYSRLGLVVWSFASVNLFLLFSFSLFNRHKGRNFIGDKIVGKSSIFQFSRAWPSHCAFYFCSQEERIWTWISMLTMSPILDGKCCLEKVVCGVGKVIEEDASDGVTVERWNIEESEGNDGWGKWAWWWSNFTLL